VVSALRLQKHRGHGAAEPHWQLRPVLGAASPPRLAESLTLSASQAAKPYVVADGT
jgi:hypothetical protein